MKKKHTSVECSAFGSATRGGETFKIRSWGASGLAHCKHKTLKPGVNGVIIRPRKKKRTKWYV